MTMTVLTEKVRELYRRWDSDEESRASFGKLISQIYAGVKELEDTKRTADSAAVAERRGFRNGIELARAMVHDVWDITPGSAASVYHATIDALDAALARADATMISNAEVVLLPDDDDEDGDDDEDEDDEDEVLECAEQGMTPPRN